MSQYRLNRWLPSLEAIFAIYGFLYYMRFWWSVFGEPLGPVLGLIRYSILIISVTLLLLRWRTLLKILPKGLFLWLLFGLCLLSSVWSIYPDQTLEGVMRSLIQIAAFGLYFTSRFNPKDQLHLLAIAMSLTLLSNLIYVVAIPSVGTHIGDKFDGAWRGFYANKNEFSGQMLWSFVVFYLLSLRGSSKRVAKIARVGLFIFPILVILSTSMTALVILVFFYAALMLWQRYRWLGRKTILTLDLASLSLMIFIGGIISRWDALVTGLGKDPTLSGRTDIWTATMVEINKKPLLGYGFSAFWSEENPAAQSIGDYLHPGFYTYHAHNGFLDILLESGWVGISLFMIGFLSTWFMALKYAYRPQSPEDCWPLAVMLLVTTYNITESSFMVSSTNWLFYITAYFSMRIWPRSYSLRPNLPPQLPDSAHHSESLKSLSTQPIAKAHETV